MTIYHLLVLAIVVIPLGAWAYRASTSVLHAAEDQVDLSNGAFLLRALAVFLGFVALASIVFFNLSYSLLQASLWMGAGLLFFGVGWLVLKLFRRQFMMPRRKIFELWLFLFAFALVTALINLQVHRITTGQ